MSILPFSRLTVSNRRSRSSRLAASPRTPVTFRPISLTASSSASCLRPVMKTYAPSSTNRLALASAMPLDPPVMTAILPSSFPMTSPLRLRLWSFGEAPEKLEMGPPVGIGPRFSAYAMTTASATHIRDAVRCVEHGLWKAPPTVPNCTMIDWDDVRYFLAVARGGSVRAAAERLGVNHSTVLRRIAQLEERLGVHMFEKLPSGYRLTAAGEEVLEFANQM